MATLLKNFGSELLQQYLKQSTEMVIIRNYARRPNIPKLRFPQWLPKRDRAGVDENITSDNKKFIQEVIETKYGPPSTDFGMKVSPLKVQPIEPITEWKKEFRRTGVIAKKIGIYPLWLKNGKKVSSTLLQIVDNEVVKYIPPEKFIPMIQRRTQPPKRRLGCLIIGAENMNPQLTTKSYNTVFNDSGVMPKRFLMRFNISPEAALQPGTPLYAAHFKPGDIVDIRAKTIGRGFQGVMKRWGFHGMPATHGVTKTHRRPGNIGSGGAKARVMPGTKLPGHMGFRWRVHRGIKILRINTKYNVIWILGHNLPGETNTYCYIYDTILKKRRYQTPPYFPTFLPGISEKSIPEELFANDVHSFSDPTIQFNEES